MRNLKRLFTLGALTLAIGMTTVTAFAATELRTPADVVASITGRTVESIIAEKTETGKTYGIIASEADKLEEFKAEILESKKAYLAEQVAAGKITQEQADTIIEALENNQATCDGTGSAKIGRGMGAKFGSNGEGLGNGGASRRSGAGMGRGAGCGMRTGRIG